MASTYLTYTQQSPSTAEGQKFTLSMWVKKSANEERQGLYGNTYDNTHRAYIYFDVSDRLSYYDSGGVNYITNRLFRDNNAFYHIVVSVDTTLSTSSDRVKIYVNGVRETSFAASSAPNQNDTLKIMNTTNTPYMGRYLEAGTSRYLQGVISHAHLTQGYTYDATPFGETDSTTGEWKIKTSVTGVTYGTNGFWWLKDSIATTDHSPNSNTFTVAGGTLTKTEDNPSNVFATLNPLTSWRGQNRTPSQVLANGNLKTGIGSSEMALLASTIGVKSGKWYWEAKSDGVSKMFFGICNSRAFGETNAPHDHSDAATSTGIYYYEAIPDFRYYSGATSTTGIASISSGDVLGFAMDCDNSVFWIHKNGVYMNSGVPTSGDTGTGAINRMFNYAGSLFYTNGVKDEMFASCYVSSTSGSGTASFNFGNGYFGTTAVSSAGTNASGIGIFEYDVPTGFTALSTKGLNL